MEFTNGQTHNLAFPILLKRSPAALMLHASVSLLISALIVTAVLILNGTLVALIPDIGITIPLFALTMIGIVVFNILAIVSILIKWNAEYYEIHETEIIHAWGIISKRRRSFPLEKVETINISQNFIERIFDFGDVSLLNPVLPNNRRLRLMDIPQPQKYLDLIKQIQQHILETRPRSDGHMIYREEHE